MHQVIVDGLEEYLARTASAEVRDRFEAHLAACSSCRAEVTEMESIRTWMKALKPEEEIAPPAGFSARLWDVIEQQRPSPFWAAFLDPVFFRRTAFACLMMLALLGSNLISRDSVYSYGSPGPETVFAIENSMPGFVEDNPSRDRDMMLVTLASYKQ